MILDGNSRVGEARIYVTAKEMQLEKEITALKEREAILIEMIKELIDTFDLFDEVPLPFKIVNKMESVVKKAREVLKELGVKGD